MELSPSQVSSATFRTSRKGYDPEEVDAFLQHVAKALEQCQQQSTAMEARARAAVARLQEMTAASEAQHREPPPPPPAPNADEQVNVKPDEAATISRTLLLAQRTADTTIAAAESEAERIRTEARTDADHTLDSTREMAAKLVEDARLEARRATDEERFTAENELQALLARRQFLVGDVDELEQFLLDQRDRLRSAARQIEALCDRVPAGLGQVNAPTLSASDGDLDPTVEVARSAATSVDGDTELHLPPEATGPFASATDLAANLSADDLPHVIDENGEGESGRGAFDPDGAPELPHRHGAEQSPD